MPELEPITREEMLLDGEDLTPITRKEKFIKRIYDKTQEIPDPITREEYFLKKAGEGSGGDVTIEQLDVSENGTYSESGKAYSPVVVNVPQPTLTTLDVTENGTYTAPSDTAYNEVDVDVPLPENAYLKKTATTNMSDAEQLPVASAKVSVTDKDKAELFLTSDGVVSEDNTPYTYRPSPSGKSCVDLSVVGGTVAWNQLMPISSYTTKTANDVLITNNGDGSFTLNGTASGNIYADIYADFQNTLTTNHIYMFVANSTADTVRVTNSYGGLNITTINKKIVKYTSGKVFVSLYVNSGTVVNNVKVYPQCIDLTQMFGSTIADAVYTMEQAEAESGIAWLKSYGFLTKDYYAYQSGKLESVNVASRKIVGFNQWDEEWEVGTYNNSTGEPQASASYWRSKNRIKIMPNTLYYAKTSGDNIYRFYYDASGNYIGNDSDVVNQTFTTPTNAYYLNIVNVNRNSYDANEKPVCINISDTSKNGAYEPYIKHTYPLDSDLTLRGIPKLNANNNLYYDGDTYESDGGVKRKRKQLVLDGLKSYESIQVDTNTVRAYIQINDMMPNNTTTINIVSAFYTYAPDYLYSSTNDVEGVCENKNATTNGIWFRIAKSKLSSYDVSGLRAYFANNPITVEYELKTPTTETAQPYTNPQLVGSTEEFVDAGTSASTPTRDVAIPVGQDSKYVNGNIYIKYLDSVTTGDIELADEIAIIPLENTTYISSNGSASIDYWSKEE